MTSYKWVTEDGASDIVSGLPQGEGVSTAFNLTFSSARQGQSVTLTPVTTVPGQGAVDGTPDTGGSFDPYAKPIPPSKTCGDSLYRQVHICWTQGDGNGRAVQQTQYRGDASGTGTSVTIDTAQGGDQRCVQARTTNSAGLSSDWTGDMCATALARTVSVSVSGYAGDPPGPCTSNCDAIRVDIGGYGSGTSYGYTTNIVPSTGGPPVSGSLSTGSDGRGNKVVGYYDRTV